MFQKYIMFFIIDLSTLTRFIGRFWAIDTKYQLPNSPFIILRNWLESEYYVKYNSYALNNFGSLYV